MADVLTSTGEFSAVTLHMLHTGETTGGLDKILYKAAEFLETEAETTPQNSTKTFSMVVFLLVGLKIGVQVYQFYLQVAVSTSGV